ncbi:MAG: hypothetical protein J1F01_05855 [Oscillospiraceae bacterium]|nr:hypothetical protein [Oscillospiraceae bacterium]
MDKTSILKGAILAAGHSLITLLWITLQWKLNLSIIFYLFPLIYIITIIIVCSADSYSKQTASCLTYVISGFIFNTIILFSGIINTIFHKLFPGDEMWAGDGFMLMVIHMETAVAAIIGIILLFAISAIRFKIKKKERQ